MSFGSSLRVPLCSLAIYFLAFRVQRHCHCFGWRANVDLRNSFSHVTNVHFLPVSVQLKWKAFQRSAAKILVGSKEDAWQSRDGGGRENWKPKSTATLPLNINKYAGHCEESDGIKRILCTYFLLPSLYRERAAQNCKPLFRGFCSNPKKKKSVWQGKASILRWRLVFRQLPKNCQPNGTKERGWRYRTAKKKTKIARPFNNTAFSRVFSLFDSRSRSPIVTQGGVYLIPDWSQNVHFNCS